MRLVMSGGGCSAIAYLGVLKYLESKGYKNKITHVGGASMGAFFALVWALDVPIANDFIQVACEFFDKKIEYPYNYDLDKFGVDDGHLFEDMLSQYFPRNDVTFEELYGQTGITLAITAACLETHAPVYFSHLETPKVAVLSAIKASVAVPFFTQAVKINNRLYVDGGIADNLPIFAWGIKEFHDKKAEYLILRVGYKGGGATPTNIFEYAISVIDTVTKNYDSNERFVEPHQCIKLNECPLAFLPLEFKESAMELCIGSNEILASVDYGFAAALAAFNSSSALRSPEYSES